MKILSICILVATLTMAVVATDIHANENKWSLEIGPEKQTYIEFEPVWLDVTLTNITSDTQWTYGLPFAPNQVGLYLDITDSNGNEVPYTGPQFLYSAGSGPGVPFATGEKDYETYNLLDLFGSRSGVASYKILWRAFPYMPTGTYAIQAHYEDIPSNEITLTIVEPADEEKDALELIEKATAILAQDNSGPSAQIFQEVVDKFPNSVFAERCYYLSRLFDQKTRNEKEAGTFDDQSFRKDLLLHYPNSGRSAGWLRTITQGLTDDEAADTLNEYEQKYPQTRCSKFAKQMRQGLKQKQVLEKEKE